MDAKQSKRPKPKLDRRNAMRNIDYDASTSSSFSPSYSSRDHGSPSIITRSLDLSPLSDRQPSFRVRGIEGEFDLICRSLGLSGPEDFSIPIAAWEAQRARSSSSHFTPPSRLRHESPHELRDQGESGAVLEKSEVRVRLVNEISASNSAVFGGNARKSGGGGGIKGLRPPPVVLKYFSPQDHIGVVNSPIRVGDVRYSDEEEDLVNEANGEREVIDETSFGKGNDLSYDSLSSGLSPSNNQNEIESVGFDATSRAKLEPIHSTFSPNGKFRRSVSSSWQKGHRLGSGSYGTVYEGFTDDGFFFAVKEVSLLDQGSHGKQSLIQLEQEIYLLSQFEHDNIVQYLGTDKDETKLYIFLELVTKGSLANLYEKYLLRDSQVSVFTRQILSGLTYLHDRNVIHRDIKCANILVDASGSVKLADFGLAKATKFNDVKSCKGTAYWMAPEVVNQKNRGYGLAADIWSLGCAVLEMLTRQPPYSHLEGMQALFQIGRGEPPPVPDSLSTDARDFIFKCLQVNPNKRPTAAQLLNHPFVKRPPQTSSVPASPRATAYVREFFGQPSVL
ncbi:mitogen-activated protein kinase kinase kinase 1-like [Prunus avium]|uniref:mitogen-activated protein kinase kinase kinase n=1 Tax=Prunus avium TaxID=42229 RepID=A0A6P5T8Z7_PRUAV|nr:mitogen-activated protein kinase kinase kinase 1-like [Prunus avium]